MNGRFWMWGIFVSVIVHAVVLLVLSVSSGREAAVSVPTASPEEPAQAQTTDEPAAAEPCPVPRPESRPEPRPEPRPVTLPAARPTPADEPAPTPETEWVTYVVKKGDMLERLVKKAGCSLTEAARYNKTTVKKLSALKVGQRIKLPKFKED